MHQAKSVTLSPILPSHGYHCVPCYAPFAGDASDSGSPQVLPPTNTKPAQPRPLPAAFESSTVFMHLCHCHCFLTHLWPNSSPLLQNPTTPYGSLLCFALPRLCPCQCSISATACHVVQTRPPCISSKCTSSDNTPAHILANVRSSKNSPLQTPLCTSA